MIGGDDDDFLDGQGSLDTLSGGAGNDTFFDAATDLIDETFTEASFPALL